MRGNLRKSGGPHIHVFLKDTNPQDVRALTKEIAPESGFHLAVLEGSSIGNKENLLAALAHLYAFPNDEHGLSSEDLAQVIPNWDSARDWLRDLTWLTGWPRNVSRIGGFILLYLDPMPLFSAHPVELATFITVIEDAAQEFQKENIPFHLVLGPMDARGLSFVQMLKAADDLRVFSSGSMLDDDG